MVQGGFKWFQKVEEGSRRVKEGEGSNGLKNVQIGLRKLKKVEEGGKGSLRLVKKVQEG